MRLHQGSEVGTSMAEKIYEAISKVTAELAKEGIGKDRKNDQQGYKFRGIDDVYNAIAPIMSKHGLCVIPRYSDRQCIERVNRSGGALFNVVVRAEYDFVCAEDGSRHTAQTFGEAMDSADKATNKAMSAAFKYALMQTFTIPTEGDNDADAHTPEVRGTVAAAQDVAAQKIADLKQAKPKEPAKKTSTLFEVLEHFKNIKAELGDELYYKILGIHGYEKSNQITDISLARKVYAQMASELNDLKIRQQGGAV